MRACARVFSSLAFALCAAFLALVPAPSAGQALPNRLGATRIITPPPPAAPLGWMRSSPGMLALRPTNSFGSAAGVMVFRPTLPMAAAPTPAPAAAPVALAISLPVRPFAAPDRHDDFGNGNSSCVPYARAVSGIQVRGNAADWWDNAAASYGRGHAPEPGSVLSFQSIDRMPLGHVAVVAQVVSKTMIKIDHANWDEAGTIMRGVPVIDVSPNNDWTQVRVDTGGGTFGSVYPTDGFIYRHRDDAVMSAAASMSAPARLASASAPPQPPVAMGRGSALPVVHNGPSGVGAFYLGAAGFGAAGPMRSSTPGYWSLTQRPRVIIASNRIGQ